MTTQRTVRQLAQKVIENVPGTHYILVSGIGSDKLDTPDDELDFKLEAIDEDGFVLYEYHAGMIVAGRKSTVEHYPANRPLHPAHVTEDDLVDACAQLFKHRKNDLFNFVIRIGIRISQLID